MNADIISDAITAGGWIVMILSVGSVVALVCYCLFRVLSLPPVEVEEQLHAPRDIDTHDTEDAD